MSAQSGYPQPGEMLGPYRIERRLGGGGMGVVFEATDTVLQRKVAVKVISPHLADDPVFRARFTREAQGQAALDSPHVVHVYAHGEADGRLYIATQLVPDGDLGRLVQAYGAPPPRVAVDLIAQVAAGLADAHATGLVHRDLKPANVLLRTRPDGVRAYLADFGIARQVDAEQSLTAAGGTVGTPTYMAPELHTGGQAGVASDVYSLGCMLWAALTGEAPYRGTSDYQIVTAHLEQPIPQLPESSPFAAAVNRVLRTAMAKRPEQRYPTAAAMRDDLRRALAQPGDASVPAPVVAHAELTNVRRSSSSPAPPPSAPPASAPSPAPPIRPGQRRRIAAVVAAAVVLLALATAGAAWALTRGDDEPTADPDPPARSPATSAPTSTGPTTPPNGSPTVGESFIVQPGDEERAVQSLDDQIQATEMLQGVSVTREQIQCVARTWIGGVGLQNMVDQGYFTRDLQYVDRPQSQMSPEMQSAIFTAASQCIFASASPSR